uniref:NADH-ubiquinone oxidoreductase chain 4L n=1 Tax=Platynereis bicanaliculata TaxID=868042 RepID=A0A7G8JTM5_9ANNE|nr:NADH dehydrogenase subunit 4L [Platynereis bicanaliculata]QNJ33923.1 NADH dehydrogenase subunit 4L [Platynereis bicanaliculata]
MTPWMLLISPILVIISLTCVILQRQHLLMALLALEVMVLSLMFMIILVSGSSWLMFIIIILTFGACEASLGLACMTAMSRSYGNDQLNSLLLNKC